MDIKISLRLRQDVPDAPVEGRLEQAKRLVAECGNERKFKAAWDQVRLLQNKLARKPTLSPLDKRVLSIIKPVVDKHGPSDDRGIVMEVQGG